jgi:hypothetical protein
MSVTKVTELSASVPQIPPLHDRIQHYPQTTMRWVSDHQWMPTSQILLSRHKQIKTAILFVHGFGGDAGGTWETFPQAVASLPTSAKVDVYFLEYPSLTPQVPFCAGQLLRFLIDLVRDPVNCIIDQSLPTGAPRREKSMRYQKILVVAHSMGAVITRRALMDLDLDQSQNGFTDKELAKFKLLFFAPAHAGSSIPRLISSGLTLNFSLAKLFGSLAAVWFQSLRDLEIGSTFLAQLTNDCRELRETRNERRASITHLRAVVYHARNDRVVSQNNFDQDPPFVPVNNKNHRSICKPNETYRQPIEALDALLQI